jgi:hypothetical protein
MYSEVQKAEIMKEFFRSAGAGEHPLCPCCSDALRFRSMAVAFTGLQLDVECSCCRLSFSWSQPQPPKPWNKVQLGYFLERYRNSEVARCPVDDCFVTYAEFGDGVLQINCPFCNRRGQVDPGSDKL